MQCRWFVSYDRIRTLSWVRIIAVRVILGECMARLVVPSVRAQSASITVATIPNVAPGITLSLNWTVTNTEGSSRTFGVGAEIRQGSPALADLGGQVTSVINAGGTAAGAFTYTVPSGWTHGVFTARCAVWTGTPGVSTWLNSHDRNFVVQPASLTPSGRIAFHRDSDNYLLHAPDSADDGHVFTIELSNASVVRRTSGLGVGNCLNPHFSPDGARLTFMAIPAGQPRLWANMRICILDLADEHHWLQSGEHGGADQPSMVWGATGTCHRRWPIHDHEQNDGRGTVLQASAAVAERALTSASHGLKWLNSCARDTGFLNVGYGSLGVTSR